MHKHKETGEKVTIGEMDIKTTYSDADGHAHTLDTAQFNRLYAECEAGEVDAAEVIAEPVPQPKDEVKTTSKGQ